MSPTPAAVRAAAEVIASELYTGRAGWEREAPEVRALFVDCAEGLAERALVAAERAS